MSEAAVPGGIRGRIGATRLLSDDRLARRAVDGDERAFAAIYHRYHQDLYRFCLAIVGNPQDAQDALQNTMVKVLRALPGEQRLIALKPWLYRIAHNESIELLRQRRPTEELDPELVTRGGGLAEDAELRERLRRLIADLGQLPERQRGALVMRELAGLDYAEIAAALGTSQAVARQTLYEARLSLRQMDEGREMTCDLVTRALSDADGRVTRRRDIRAHLRACAGCRRFRDELAQRRGDLAALSPLPAIAAAGLLQGLLGSGGGAAAGSGAGLAGAVGGGAAKSLGATAAVKSAAAVAVVAAVGVGAADRGGVVDVTPWGGGSERVPAERSAMPSPGSPPMRSSGAGAGADSTAARARQLRAREEKAGLGAALVQGRSGKVRGEPMPGTPASATGAGSGEAHPHGRGHEKQHPSAADHGQQTAASHKASGKGRGGKDGGGRSGKQEPGPPAKPTKAAKSPKPTPAAVPEAGKGKGVKVAPPPPSQGPSESSAQPPAVPAPSPPQSEEATDKTRGSSFQP